MTETHKLANLDNPSYRYSLGQTQVALVPFDSIMKTIVESAKVSTTLRDLYVQEMLGVPKREFNPSRRDSQ